MPKSQWMLHTKRDDFENNASTHGISSITARVIRNRDVVGEEQIRKFLHGTIDQLYNPYLLKDMEKSIAILKTKIQSGLRIRIVGDYDIDGVCSTYLLYTGLMRVGANVDYEIPDRIKDGYGINEMIIQAAHQDGIDTIITCDNGIAAIDQIGLAKQFGMTVIVTDHHEIVNEDGVEVLPPADAIINPKQQDCQYPYPEICGGLVAYKLVQALYQKFAIPPQEWQDLIEFAAIATVGDVMKLQDENRIVVKEGLKKIRCTSNPGLKKLIERNVLDAGKLSAYHIGFVIGPCLNAGGRLQSAKLALEMLLCREEEAADRLARQLKDLNEQRKDMTAQGIEAAAALVETYYYEDKVLVVYLPDCHESLAGIIAGRLRERYQKPAFVLTKAEEGVKGSGRSIESYHMFQALTQVKALLIKFGGHPMAAGLLLKEQDVSALRQQLNEKAELTEADFVRKIWIDVAAPTEYMNEPLIKELELLEPFGQGNEKPLFAQRQMQIRKLQIIGRNKNAVKLILVSENGSSVEALWFGEGEQFAEEVRINDRLDVVYYPSINEYNGNRSIQIMVKEYRLSGST